MTTSVLPARGADPARAERGAPSLPELRSALQRLFGRLARKPLHGAAPLAVAFGKVDYGTGRSRALLLASRRELVAWVLPLSGGKTRTFDLEQIASVQDFAGSAGHTISFFASGQRVSLSVPGAAEARRLLSVLRRPAGRAQAEETDPVAELVGSV